MSDPLCVCGHRASHHDTSASGDTRCLAVEARQDLLEVFDDGRDTAVAYCGCVRFTPARPLSEPRSCCYSPRRPSRRCAPTGANGSATAPSTFAEASTPVPPAPSCASRPNSRSASTSDTSLPPGSLAGASRSRRSKAGRRGGGRGGCATLHGDLAAHKRGGRWRHVARARSEPLLEPPGGGLMRTRRGFARERSTRGWRSRPGEGVPPASPGRLRETLDRDQLKHPPVRLRRADAQEPRDRDGRATPAPCARADHRRAGQLPARASHRREGGPPAHLTPQTSRSVGGEIRGHQWGEKMATSGETRGRRWGELDGH
jgi:hypothetical protein